jgi:RimJ/RimL family protein N-acetyltransferase
VGDLAGIAWPPPPIRTTRLTLRELERHDRDAVIEILTSPEVRAYLGGPRQRDEVERTLPAVLTGRAGLFVIDLEGAMIGIVTVDRRDASRRGHVRAGGGEAELSYVFLPQSWGCGYASEACAAVIEWFAKEVPGEPLVLCTQVANDPSIRLAAKLGFNEVERFEEHGAQQWFGIWEPQQPE